MALKNCSAGSADTGSKEQVAFLRRSDFVRAFLLHAAGLSEFGGGVLLAAGLLAPLGAAAVVSAMLVAMISVHVKNGFFAMSNGIELPFLYAVAAVAVGWTGTGAFSLDRQLGLELLFPSYAGSGLLVLAVIGAIVTLTLRDRSDSHQTEERATVKPH
jgi:uncharacterized membrane protein YphA (DoxX/SURF4 family)